MAQIDSLRIDGEQLRAFAERAPVEGDSPQARRQSYLRGLLASELLLREARDRGLDTTSAVRWKIDERRRRQILRRYRNEVVWGQVTVSDSMVRAYYDSLGLGTQRQVWGILVETQADARDVLSLLRLGRSFEEVAAQRSLHRPSAAQGGALGYVSLMQARALGIPDSLYLHLGEGELSPILEEGDRYQVVRFLGSRTTEIGEHRAGIEALLRQRLEAQRESQQVEALADRLHWRLVPGTLKLLQERTGVDGTLRKWQLDPEEANTPLFTYTGGYVTLGEYLDALWNEPQRAETGWGIGDGEAVLAAAATLRTDRLFMADARELGLDQVSDDSRDRRLRRELLIELRQQVLHDRAGGTTPADARRYYEAHPEVFRQADDIVVVEAFVKTEAEAKQIRAEVAAGADFLQLAAERTQRDESLWESPGVVRLGEYERLAWSGLYNAAQRAEVGVLTGPVAVQDGYSVFQVVGREPGTVQPFDEKVERRALSLTRNERATRAFDSFVSDLLDAHEDEVQVFPTELEAALPDTLLRRLAGG